MTYKLKEIRESKGISQQKLAEVTGISRQTIIGIENNPDYVTTTKTLAALADGLGVNVTDIFFEDSVK